MEISTCQRLVSIVVNANKHLLSNDQSNACVAGTTRSVNASCSDVITVPLFFSPPPTPPTRAIIPDARPLGTFENQDVAVTVRRAISKRSHEKIGDGEQSNLMIQP